MLLLLAGVCLTAGTGRSHFEHRAVIAASDRAQLLEALGPTGGTDDAESLCCQGARD